ncbi:MAG: DUF5597 domain-containing protein [Sedimentisphaerales bacterium]|nr:DUF5597 domain-containing protein [Sedimentisphaerales bacterium]
MSTAYFSKRSVMATCIIFTVTVLWVTSSECAQIPHLRKQGTAVQLIVDDVPFLIFGGELGNSSASNLDYMKAQWPKLVTLNLNTVLAPVYWDLIEPQEGNFDFTLVDGLIREARRHNLRLVLLWFASFKNSMSCYAPIWVKANQPRFPRAQNKEGRGKEIVSVFSEENCAADARAFTALMKHLRQVDGETHTVIMVQVENEMGMIPEARDYCDAANDLFSKPVPKELMDYLVQNKNALIPEFRKTWAEAGFKTSGTWEEVFGEGLGTDEIFMAWHYARYTNRVVEAGKAEYPLPMFVNAALIRPGHQPGQYPSAGPLPHLMDIWRASGPQIDFFCPDIHFPNFAEWCENYHRSGNPLFIPEARREPQAAAKVFYAMGQHDAIGFCPFSIESTSNPENDPLGRAYDILSQLAPIILKHQGKGTMAGALLDKDHPTQQIKLGDYALKVSHDYTWSWSSGWGESGQWPRAGGLFISTGPDEYIIAGTGIIVTFAPNSPGDPIAGIASIQEGRYVEGRWVPGRWMNGDQSHQGRHLRIPANSFGIQRIKLYRYH